MHKAIETKVIPHLASNSRPNWDLVIRDAVAMAGVQREFTHARRYRDAKVTKKQAGDSYCALALSEEGRDLTPEEWDATVGVIELAFRNLAGLDPFWEAIGGRGRYFPEMHMHLNYDGARIVVMPDLVCFRGFGKPTFVDWKVSEAMGGSDARMQLGVYAWAMTQTTQWPLKRMEDAELLEVQLLKSAVFTHRCDEEVAVEIENRVYRSIDEIRSLCGDGNFKTLDAADFEMARNANSCGLCPFRKVCAASLAPAQQTEGDTPIAVEEPVGMYSLL